MKENQATTSIFNLENALEDIERIVSRMEKDVLSIESALVEFEKGISLIRHCQKALEKAEQKVSLLTEKNGEMTLVSYSSESEPKEDDV